MRRRLHFWLIPDMESSKKRSAAKSMTWCCSYGNRIGGLDVPGFALLAVGGYGRGTLHPESDLDLLLFFKDVVNETVVKKVLDPLWDLPFRVGHQIRQASDFKKFDPTHMESYAAFLDGRYLTGNAATATEFQKVILPGFHRTESRRLSSRLDRGQEAAIRPFRRHDFPAGTRYQGCSRRRS